MVGQRTNTLTPWLAALLLSAGTVVGAIALSMMGGSANFSLERTEWAHCATAAPAPPNRQHSTLVVYDSSGPFKELSRVYADLAGTLASHFGETHLLRVADYQQGLILSHDALIYVGLNFDEPLPDSFLSDVVGEERPVVWLGQNLHQLERALSGRLLSDAFGWRLSATTTRLNSVGYKGRSLSIPADTEVLALTDLDLARVTVLATGHGVAGSPPSPYVVNSRNLTWFADVPLDAAESRDRYLVLADVLYDVLGADTPDQALAMIRLEDVGPLSDPDRLRDSIDVLYELGVPFSVAVYPVYRGAPDEGDGNLVVPLRRAPEVVKAIEYGLDRGGTLVLHGYTHQYGQKPNPISGRSADDFEFFEVHFEGDEVVYDGPVAEDSQAWVYGRIDLALAELDAVGLPRPRIFEFPHYAGSPAAYKVVAAEFGARYDPPHLISAAWDGESAASPFMFSIAPPYLVRDSYGSVVIPETLGFVRPVVGEPGASSPAQVVANAKALSSIVRGSIASLFFHPYLESELLREVVGGLRAEGYEFAAPCDL